MILPDNPYGVPTDTTEWHPLLQSALEDMHPTAEAVLSPYFLRSAHEAGYVYGTCVMSVVFDWLDQGVPPFCSDIAIALDEAGVVTARGRKYTRTNLYEMLHERRLWPALVAYRRQDNLAYVARLNQRDKRSIWQHHSLT